MKYSKTIILSLVAVCALPAAVNAQEKLNDEQKSKAIEWLEQVKTSQLAASSSRVKKAKASLEEAAASDTAAFNLYMDAMKAQFMNSNNNMFSNMLSRSSGSRRMMMGGPRGGGNDSKKSTPQAQFNEWKQQNTGSNMKPGFKKAIQLQCKWMLMNLKKAEQEKLGNEVDYSSSILACLSEMSAAAKEINESLMQMPMANSVIRNHLKINDYRSEVIPDNIIDIGGVFERALLEPHRKNKDIPKFRSLWDKRIAIEVALASAPSSNTQNTASAKREQEATKATLYVSRQWEKERACFQLGDEVQALANMQKIMTGMTTPDEKHKAIRDLESLLSAKKNQTAQEETNSRPNGGPGRDRNR